MKERVEIKSEAERQTVIEDKESQGLQLCEDQLHNEIVGYTDPVTHNEYEYDEEGNIIETTTIVDEPEKPIIERKHYLIFTDEPPEERPPTLQEQINELREMIKSIGGWK